MARRRPSTAAQAEASAVREILRERFDARSVRWGTWRDPRAGALAAALDRGEPIVVHEWELPDSLRPMLVERSPHHVRVETDGTLTPVDAIRGSNPIQWREVI